MEYTVWIYKPLEAGQISQLMSSGTDLSAQFAQGSAAPKQPLSGKTAELVLYGVALQSVQPTMEYRRINRAKFLREPILSCTSETPWDIMTQRRQESEYEEIGISTLRVKGRLYYANHENSDTLKLAQWATEAADGKDGGFRTVVFASSLDKKSADAVAVNFRKIVLPRAFVLRYEEFYDEHDGMGAFTAVFQQSVAELRDFDKNIAEASA